MLEITEAAKRIIENFDISSLRNLSIVIKFSDKELCDADGLRAHVSLINKDGVMIYSLNGSRGLLHLGPGDTLTIDQIRVSPTIDILPPEGGHGGEYYEDVVWNRIKKILRQERSKGDE